MKKYYGEVEYDGTNWIFKSLEPHVSIRLKQLFPKILKTSSPPFKVKDSDEVAVDLEWFFSRYPVKVNKKTKEALETKSNEFKKKVEALEKIKLPNFNSKIKIKLKDGHALDDMQLKALDFFKISSRLLLVDPIGSGKTYTAIGASMLKGKLPAAFVVQTHLPKQFKSKIEEISNLTVHVIKSNTPYDLPKADIYIFKYSSMSGWVDVFAQGFFKFALFDEVQELRHGRDTAKGQAASVLTNNVSDVLATTGTPIYGYGIEFFNVFDIIKRGALGDKDEFIREWCGNDNKIISDTKAFSSFLKESNLMLKRDKSDFKEIADISTKIIPEKIDYDPKMVKTANDLAKQLALKTLYGSFTEQGQSARLLDLQLREQTGISKAKNIAHFVRMLVESGEQVLLAGWHREVYHILNRELKDLGISMYTGSETPRQKQVAKDNFLSGENKVMIISHASGAGLDGLQHVCSTVVIGELAWSEEIHNQIIGRVSRRGQENIVYAFILISEFGSDPVIQDILGLKYRQQNGILNEGANNVIEDDQKEKISRIKKLAKDYLTANNFDFDAFEKENAQKHIQNDDTDIDDDDGGEWINF